MDRDFIKTRIAELKDALEKGQTSFILSRELRSYRKEIKELQSICEHEYQNGMCIYCEKEEAK